jgi:hypothetical protein
LFLEVRRGQALSIRFRVYGKTKNYEEKTKEKLKFVKFARKGFLGGGGRRETEGGATVAGLNC